MDKKDWYKAMKRAGFKHMDFVKSAREAAKRPTEGWAYRVVAVDLEIKLPNGYFSRDKVEVDLQLLETSRNPVGFLCEEVLKYIKAAYKAAGIEYKTGSENNRPA